MRILDIILNAIKLFFGIEEKQDTIDIGGGLSVVVETEMVEVKEEPKKKASKKKSSKKKAIKKKKEK